jgi:hypothetical protein
MPAIPRGLPLLVLLSVARDCNHPSLHQRCTGWNGLFLAELVAAGAFWHRGLRKVISPGRQPGASI